MLHLPHQSFSSQGPLLIISIMCVLYALYNVYCITLGWILIKSPLGLDSHNESHWIDLDSASGAGLWVCLQGWTARSLWALCVCAPPVQPEPANSSPPLLQPLIPVLWMCGCNYRNWEDPIALGICSTDHYKVGRWGSGS